MRIHVHRRPTGNGVAAALVLLLIGASSIAACRIFGYEDSSEGTNALVLPSCGPTDGAATEIYLSADVLQCNRLPVRQFEGPQQETFIRVILLGFRPPVEGTFSLGHDPEHPYGRGGTAYRCVKEGDCEQTYEGTVTFGKPTEEGHIPLYIRLQFDSGEQVNGSYEALTCEFEFRCG
ncbi:MAG TPA: hypothetical protein VFG50_07065 [Rhodothermales bacterium]|nr:hypothetical protein [Rhodothermales bacterium]